MLKVGDQILNLTNPQTDTERDVAKRFKEIISQYKLDEGGSVKFVYPDRYLTPNKAVQNKGKIDKPASFRILFRDIVRSEKGASEWKYFETVVGSGDKRKFIPDGMFFDGNLVLTIKDIDKIFFLLDICSRLENGKNVIQGRSPYLTVDDTLKKADEFAAIQKQEYAIRSAIYGDDSVCLGEDSVRLLAGAIGIQGADTQNVTLLRKQTFEILMRDKATAVKRIDEVKKSDRFPEMLKLVNELNDNKLIAVEGYGVGKKQKAWHFFDAVENKVGTEILKLSAGGNFNQQLAKHLAKDEMLAAGLAETLAQFNESKAKEEE